MLRLNFSFKWEVLILMFLFEIFPEKIRFYVNILIYKVEYILIHELFDCCWVMALAIILSGWLALFNSVEYILKLRIKPITCHVHLLGQAQWVGIKCYNAFWYEARKILFFTFLQLYFFFQVVGAIQFICADFDEWVVK